MRDQKHISDRLDRLYTSGNKQQFKANFFAISTFVPAIIFLTGLFFIPLLFTFHTSFHEATVMSTGDYIGLENYVAMYGSDQFWSALSFGAIFAVTSVSFQLVVGLIFALLLNNKFRGSSIARTFAILPYLIPTVIVMTVWLWMLSPSYGLINLYLVEFGVISETISFLSDPGWAFPILVLVSSWKYISFAVIILLARLQSIDPALYEQAKISGANRYQMFMTVTLPNLRGAILLVVLLRSIWMFNHFDVIWLLTGGGPFRMTTNLPVYVFVLSFVRGNLALGSAAAIILFVFLLVGASIYFKVFKPSQEVEATAR